ncbi:MAG: UDP-N-acetylmuramoyl-L-alanine--D-glutamate ligase [candidate division WOR-3 bacterium]
MIGVIGFGRSGKAVAKLIEKLGETPFVSDLTHKPSEIPYPNETGKHTDKLLQMDLLVVSPGVSPNIPILLKAKEKKIPIIGEIEFASRYIKGKIIAITGTNGKTTTAALTHHILKGPLKERVLLGGNIYPGKPLSSLVEKTKEDSITVIEVSSYQLERIEKFHPWIATITNISPDHLDRHSSLEEYLKAKLNIFKNQRKEDYSILNKDDKILSSLKLSSKTLYFSLKGNADIYLNGSSIKDREGGEIFKEEDLFIKGEAFIEDGMIASLIASIIGVNKKEIRKRIKTFKGVPHRMETVVKRKDLWIINNSMCTNPIAFVKSLQSFPASCVIVGGRMKVKDINPIIFAIKNLAKFVVLIGESTPEMEKALKRAKFNNFSSASSMKEAIEKALNSNCEKIILSPGASSFDWFKDFAERGNIFKKEVKRLLCIK